MFLKLNKSIPLCMCIYVVLVASLPYTCCYADFILKADKMHDEESQQVDSLTVEIKNKIRRHEN